MKKNYKLSLLLMFGLLTASGIQYADEVISPANVEKAEANSPVTIKSSDKIHAGEAEHAFKKLTYVKACQKVPI